MWDLVKERVLILCSPFENQVLLHFDQGASSMINDPIYRYSIYILYSVIDMVH